MGILDLSACAQGGQVDVGRGNRSTVKAGRLLDDDVQMQLKRPMAQQAEAMTALLEIVDMVRATLAD